MKEYKINKYLKLKLENGQTRIYVNNQQFLQCKYLLLNIPLEERPSFDKFNSIDEIKEYLDDSLENQNEKRWQISPEVEFWGHCSNLQAWAENDYNTNLIHSNLAFPLLKQLFNVGDPKARTVFKEEILKRLKSKYQPIFEYLVNEGFLAYLSREEIEMVLSDLEFLKEKRISIYGWKDEFFRNTIREMGNAFIKKAKETFNQDMRFNALNWIKRCRKMAIWELEDRYGEYIISLFAGLPSEVRAELIFEIYHQIFKESWSKNPHEAIIALARELKHQFFQIGISFLIHENRLITIRTRRFYSPPSCVFLKNQGIEHVKNLEGLDQLIHKNTIDLSHNKLRTITGLEAFNQLEFLKVSFNQIEDIEALKVNSLLRELNLAHNNVQNIDALEELNKLEILDLTGNPITAVPDGILELPNLKELHVINCPLEQIIEPHSIDLQIFSNQSIEDYQEETRKRAKISNRFTDIFKKWHLEYSLRNFLKCSNEDIQLFKQERKGNMFYDGKPTKGFKRWIREKGLF